MVSYPFNMYNFYSVIPLLLTLGRRKRTTSSCLIASVMFACPVFANKSYSNNSSSSSKGYRFSSPQDVIGWLADKSFYNGNRRLRIRPNGVWLNDYCATGAPNVERWESWKALIRAYTATGERLSFFVDPINGTVTDEASDVFRLR